MNLAKININSGWTPQEIKMANMNHLFSKDKDKTQVDSSSTENQKTAPKLPADEKVEVKGEETKPLSQESTKVVETATEETDPYANWTKEDLAKARKEAMDEAAKARIEKKELEKQLTESFDKKLSELQARLEPYVNEVLENRKNKEAEEDNKKSLTERLEARDRQLEKERAEKQQIEDSLKETTLKLQSELDRKVAEINAYESHYKTQLDKELAEVPEKHKSLAELIVKGSGDNVQAALTAIRQAKADNIFGTKKVEVFHGVPNAKQGARSDAASAQKSLTKNEKIKEGIKTWQNKQLTKNIRKM